MFLDFTALFLDFIGCSFVCFLKIFIVTLQRSVCVQLKNDDIVKTPPEALNRMVNACTGPLCHNLWLMGLQTFIIFCRMSQAVLVILHTG